MENENNLDLLQKWKSLAEDDLKVAVLSFKNGIYLQASFHCQQCVEKSIKALIIYFKNEEPPYSHDLIRLYKILDGTIFFDQKKLVLFGGLNPYYIRSRYPSYKDEMSKNLTKQKVTSYIELAKEVLEWLEVEPKS